MSKAYHFFDMCASHSTRHRMVNLSAFKLSPSPEAARLVMGLRAVAVLGQGAIVLNYMILRRLLAARSVLLRDELPRAFAPGLVRTLRLPIPPHPHPVGSWRISGTATQLGNRPSLSLKDKRARGFLTVGWGCDNRGRAFAPRSQ